MSKKASLFLERYIATVCLYFIIHVTSWVCTMYINVSLCDIHVVYFWKIIWLHSWNKL